jgi:hypothetical protein
MRKQLRHPQLVQATVSYKGEDDTSQTGNINEGFYEIR